MLAYAYVLSVLAIVGLTWRVLHQWYFRRVEQARVYHADGRELPTQPPALLMGHLGAIYRAPNRLAAYNAFHDRLGEILQLFWLWRPQISVADYAMAREVLSHRQGTYRKYPITVDILRRLYGSSVLTAEGKAWRRYRSAMKRIFSKNRGRGFHAAALKHTEQCLAAMRRRVDMAQAPVIVDLYDELAKLFLQISLDAALGRRMDHGRTSRLLESLNLVLTQSVRPVHSFVPWWHRVPLPANRSLARAFRAIDDCLFQAVRQARMSAAPASQPPLCLVDLLVASATGLTDTEIRDNVLAIILNGHESSATTAALTVLMLTRSSQALERARAEIDDVMISHGGRLTAEAVDALPFLSAAIEETLRLYPPVVGLNRMSTIDQSLYGWWIPADRAVGIALMPLHRQSRFYGNHVEDFRPERYVDADGRRLPTTHRRCRAASSSAAQSREGWHAACPPLAFGDGPRRCLGEHFARHTLMVVLASLLHRFELKAQPDVGLALDLKRFALSVSLFPKQGVRMELGARGAPVSASRGTHDTGSGGAG